MDADTYFDYWMFLSGLGIFLFGMFHLEKGLSGLAGNTFKKVLQKFTKYPVTGALTGAGVTAVLQSSSLVMLLVVAFLGSGMMQLRNAISVVFGANLGTTVTAWIVATIGFKISISNLSYPFLALGTLSYLMLDSRPFLKNLGAFLMGFGLIFLGLDNMKLAIEDVAATTNLSEFANFGLIGFLLIGVVITALIQSSSAMIVIVLSALHAEMIDIYAAFAIVIGANIGTTSTLLIASLNGTPDKKRLAWTNVGFKLIVGSLFFFILRPVVDILEQQFHVEDTLMELVLLNTVLNLTGLIIFLPFVGVISRFMSTLFVTKSEKTPTKFISNASTHVVDVALIAMQKELSEFFSKTTSFVNEIFENTSLKDKKLNLIQKVLETNRITSENYEQLENIDMALTNFYTEILKNPIPEEEALTLSKYLKAQRAILFAAKSINDLQSDLLELSKTEDVDSKKLIDELKNLALEVIQDKEKLSSMKSDSVYNTCIQMLYALPRKESQFPVSRTTYIIKNITIALDELRKANRFIKNGL